MNEIMPAPSHDMSFLGLFLQADPIVKSVMILLVLASLGCWTIVFEKLLRFRSIRGQARAFEAAARSGDRLHPQMPGVTGRIVTAGHEAWRDQDISETRAERRERSVRCVVEPFGEHELNVAQRRTVRRVENLDRRRLETLARLIRDDYTTATARDLGEQDGVRVSTDRNRHHFALAVREDIRHLARDPSCASVAGGRHTVG